MSKRAKISIQSGAKAPIYNNLKRTAKHFKSEFDKVMYYVHYELTDKKLKSSVLTYFKRNKLDYKSADAAPSHYFSVIGKVCHIKNNGGEVPEDWDEFISSHASKIIEMGKAVLKKKEEPVDTEFKKPTINVQDRMKAQATEIAGEFEGWIDEFSNNPLKFKPSDYNPHEVMTTSQMKSGHARWMIKFYNPAVEEITTAIAGTDADIKLAYLSYPKPQLKKLLVLYQSIIDASELIINSSKLQRKPRKVNAFSADKIVSKLKYSKGDHSLGLVSVNPRNIVGASELWVYNTKSRKFGKYIAIDSTGLSVKGVSIISFASSSVEKTLRNPPAQLKEFKSASKKALRTFVDNISTVDTKLKGRLNVNHVLLKIVK